LFQSSISTLIEPALAGQQQLTREVQELFQEKLSIRVQSSNQDLFQSGILDSTNMVQLLLQIEERFGLRLPIEQVGADSLRSVGSIAELVSSCRSTPFMRPAPAPVEREEDTVRDIKALFLDKMAIRVDSVEADLFQTGVFDSMTLVEFILHLEEHFGLRFPMEDLELDSVLSVSKLAEMVNNGKRAVQGDRF